MKKKIKDLTIDQLTDFCQKQNHCEDCPLHLYCGWNFCSYTVMDLEQEVEVDE